MIISEKPPLLKFLHNRCNPRSIADVLNSDIIIGCYAINPAQYFHLHYCEAAVIGTRLPTIGPGSFIEQKSPFGNENYFDKNMDMKTNVKHKIKIILLREVALRPR